MKEKLLPENGAIALKQTADLKKEADRVIRRHTMLSAGVGLIPIPMLDAAAVLGIQISLIRSISKVYDVEFKESIAQTIIGSLVGSLGAVGLAKAIPGLGTILGGLTMSGTAAASTYALGKVFTQHFDQGGTLLDFDPVKSREYFAKEFKDGRRYVANAEKETTKEDDGNSIINLFNGKRRKQEELERQEMMQTNKDLMAAVTQLREEVASMKKH